MITRKQLFYTAGVVLPAIALALAGAQAASPTTQTKPVLTDAQKAAVQQAQDLRKQADEILKNAGLPVGGFGRFMHPGMGQRPAMPALTDDQKAALKQAMDLRKQGKNDDAKAVLDKAGIKFGFGMGQRGMHGKKPAATPAQPSTQATQ